MDNSIEIQFHDKTLEIYEDAKNLCGYSARRFLQKIKIDGGVKAAKSWLNPKDLNKLPTSGFLVLVENGRLDISLEALVLREPWRKLFSKEELNVAAARLKKYGYNATELNNKKSEQLIPEEIAIDEFFEGSKFSITVNAYERNLAARNSCIEYYGTSCVVCNFNFGKIYYKMTEVEIRRGLDLTCKNAFRLWEEANGFVKNNAVSTAMQNMLDVLQGETIAEESETLQRFYESVKKRAAGIDNAEGKQLEALEQSYAVAPGVNPELWAGSINTVL